MNKSDLLNRYILELTKYMTYENSLIAKKDLVEIINEELGPYYDLNELQEFLESLGSPYNLAMKYETESNFLLSGRNYKIYIYFLKITNIIMCLSLVIYGLIKKFNNFLDFLESLKVSLVMIFVALTLSSFIAEKVKNTRIIQSIIRDFKIKDLYEKKKFKFDKISLINFLVSSLIFFYMITDFAIINNELEVKFIQISFFLLVLRDINRVSEGEIGKFISVLSLVVDIIVLILMLGLIKLNLNFVYGIYVVFALQIFDLIYIIKKNIKLGE